MSKRSAQELSKRQMGWAEVLTCAEMRAIESAAMESGAVTGLELMERAGAAVAGHIRLRWPKAGRVTVLCGPGNNGGDGYVVARHLADAGWQVRVLGLDNTPGPDAAEMKRRWAEMGAIRPLTKAEFAVDPGDLVVDAMFGTGATRPLTGEVRAISRWLGLTHPSPVVAVEGVSGLCLDSGDWLGGMGDELGANRPRAALTVTFHAAKIGHLLGIAPILGGDLVVADIGIPQSPYRDGAGALRRRGQTRAWMQVPPHHSWQPELTAPLGKQSLGHKFSSGHALVVAGGPGRSGAARLAARAALRTGAGLVSVAPPKSALSEYAVPPDAIMREAIDDTEDLLARLRDKRLAAIIIGPACGIERSGELLDAATASERPIVLDADALTALSLRDAPFSGLHARCVLTPHRGEFARLFPDLARRLAGPTRPSSLPPNSSEIARQIEVQTWRQQISDQTGPLYSKLDAAREAAARCGAVVLLKGPDTVIAAPDGRARIHSAFDVPWLATAGAGDVLAGIIGGLLARGLPPLDAAATGAFLHAEAARRFGPGLIADDLPDMLPAVFRDLGL